MKLRNGARIWFSVALTGLVSVLLSTLPLASVSGAQITSRSLLLQAGGSAGGSYPGGVVCSLSLLQLQVTLDQFNFSTVRPLVEPARCQPDYSRHQRLWEHSQELQALH